MMRKPMQEAITSTSTQQHKEQHGISSEILSKAMGFNFRRKGEILTGLSKGC